MYTLSKGPSKIVASARRGPHRTFDFEGYDTREKKSVKSAPADGGQEDQSSEMSSSGPRPTFQRKPANMKKPVAASNLDQSIQENHIAVTSLLSKQWKKAEKGIKKDMKHGEGQIEIYKEKEAPNLQNFQPIDLDTFLAQRMMNNVMGKQPSS